MSTPMIADNNQKEKTTAPQVAKTQTKTATGDVQEQQNKSERRG